MRKQFTIAVFLGILVGVVLFLSLEYRFFRYKVFLKQEKELKKVLTFFIKYFYEGDSEFLKKLPSDTYFLYFNLKTKKYYTNAIGLERREVLKLISFCQKKKDSFFLEINGKEHNLVAFKKIKDNIFVVYKDLSLSFYIIKTNAIHFFIFTIFLLLIIYFFIKFIAEENIDEPFRKVINELRIIRKKGIPHQINLKVNNEFQEVIDAFNKTTNKLQQALKMLQEKNEFIQKQIELAKKVQQSFLPRKFLENDNYSLYFSYTPASYLSGDFFGFSEVKNYLYFYIGDISGKGISSALIMSSISILIKRRLSYSSPSPEKLIREINHDLQSVLPDDRFVTFQVYRLDKTTGTLTYSNAGHPPPFIYKTKEKKIISCEPIPSAPIGFSPDWISNLTNISLEEGDILITYTDGLTELRNSEGKLIYKFDLNVFLEDIFRESSSPQEAIELINQKIKEISSQEFKDDLTILLFQFKSSSIFTDTEKK